MGKFIVLVVKGERVVGTVKVRAEGVADASDEAERVYRDHPAFADVRGDDVYFEVAEEV